MKKKRLCLIFLLLAILLAGCGRRTEPAPAPPEPEVTPPEEAPAAIGPDAPLYLEELRVEVSRGGLSSQRLMEAARALPGLLQEALAERHVHAAAVQVTVGSSPAATVQALESGGVDLAFLPAEALAVRETGAAVLLASVPGGGGTELPKEGAAGFSARIYAAPTEYGENLAVRAGKDGNRLTWEELRRARWGVLEEDSLLGRRAVNLWLADGCGGSTLREVSSVTVYESFNSLLQAASAGEIDVFPMDDQIASAWAEGGSGSEIGQTLYQLGQTPAFYGSAAALAPGREELLDPERGLREPLALALEDLCGWSEAQDGGDRETRALCRDVFGQYPYTGADEAGLASLRRLLALEGYAGE